MTLTNLLESFKKIELSPRLKTNKNSNKTNTETPPIQPVINRRGATYKIEYLLLFSILAMLSGCITYSEIEVWMQQKFLVLRQTFQLRWTRAPSDSLVQDVFSRIKTDSLEAVLREQGIALSKIQKNTLIHTCIDGKTLRGSYDKVADRSAIMLLTCFEPLKNIILGHIEIHDKDSEIPAAKILLDGLGLETYITSDAMHCQKKQQKFSKEFTV
jgi:hypothetical protein